MHFQITFENEKDATVQVYSAGNVTWKMKMRTKDLASKTEKEQKDLVVDHMMASSFHVSTITSIASPMPHVWMVEDGLEIQRPKRKKRGAK